MTSWPGFESIRSVDVVVDQLNHKSKFSPLDGVHLVYRKPGDYYRCPGGEFGVMSIDGKHWYRFNFLKSERWENIRLETLVKFDATCQVCGIRDLSNDVHHIWYDNPEEPEEGQLTVLCRECHDKIHLAIEPAGAHSNEDKMKLLELFKEAKFQIQRVLKAKRSHKKCQACGSDEAFLVNPVLRISPADGRGMSLCPHCQDRIYSELPDCYGHGSSQQWSMVKVVICKIQNEIHVERGAINRGKGEGVQINPSMRCYLE